MTRSLSLTESQDAIDAAIQSAESLFASLLDRASLSSVSSPTEVDSLSPRHLVPPSPDSSLQTLGAASLGPAQLMAHAQAAGPIMEGIQSPKESLNVFVCRPSVTSMPIPPDYDTLYEMLKEREKDLDVSAKIGETLLRRSELLERDLTTALDTRLGSEQHLAQLRHELGQKDDLLKLYARQEKEREFTAAGSTEDSKPEWVQVLTEECKELRESNMQLRIEADRLRRETAEIELQEKDLVHQCLQQFSEAKQRLSELREETEQKTEENVALQGKLQNLSNQNEDLLNKQQQLLDDNDLLRDQLAEAQDAHSQLTNEVSELQDKYGECSVMLKEAQEDIVALKDASLHISTVGGSNTESSANVEHESIVQEIEEVLRKEIIAASTLPERPRSPNHYARQRTMVVMETVRAATLATARRLERLKAEAEKQKQEATDEQGARSDQPSAVPAFSPIAASSPANRLKLAFRNMSVGTAGLGLASPAQGQRPPSPVSSDAGSTISLPEEIMKYRNHPYFAPEKLQIVKPLEGSVTLLKWKLLATPQLGGAKTFFSDASLPGVHKKGGSEKHPETNQFSEASYGDLRQKSKSTFDLSSSPGHSSLRRKHSKREKLIRTKASDLNVTVGSERGMNVMTELLPGSEGEARSPEMQRVKKRPDARTDRRRSDGERKANEAAGSSLLRQVGNLLGFSRFSRHPDPELQEEGEDGSVVESTDTGLAGLL